MQEINAERMIGIFILKRWQPGLVPKILHKGTKTGRKSPVTQIDKYLACLFVTKCKLTLPINGWIYPSQHSN